MQSGGEGIHLSRNPPQLPTDPCSGTIECALAGIADHFLLLLWLLVMVAVALASLVFLPRAQQLCDRERRRATAEYDAFDEFLTRIQGFSAAGSVTSAEAVGSGPLMHQQGVAQVDGLAKVRDAYRDTVMQVPHYEEDYGESLIEHMGAELGEEIAYATVDGGQLVPPLKQSLVSAARDARDRRADFLEMLDEEADSLERHANKFEELADRIDRAAAPSCADETYNGLRRRRHRFQRYEADIEAAISDRQADRTGGRTGSIQAMNGADLQEYLYTPMDVNYPVLAEGTKLLSQIEIGLRRIEDELIYRS